MPVVWFPVADEEPTYGETEDFVVTVSEWCRLESPECVDGYYLDELREEFGDRVRFVFQPRPHTPPEPRGDHKLNAPLVAAHQLGYFDEMRRAISSFVQEDELRPELDELADRAGVDADELRRMVDDPEIRQTLKRSEAGSDSRLERGSPALIVNGLFVPGHYGKDGAFEDGVPPKDYIVSLIEDQLELAEHLRERTGKTGDELYELLVEMNLDDPPSPPLFEPPLVGDPDELDRELPPLDELPAFGPEDGLEVVALHNLTFPRNYRVPFIPRAHHAFWQAVDIVDTDVRFHWLYTTGYSASPSRRDRLAIEAHDQGRFGEVYRELFDFSFVFGNPVEEFVARRTGVEPPDEGDHREYFERLGEDEGDAELSPVYLIGDEVVVGAGSVAEFADALRRAEDAD